MNKFWIIGVSLSLTAILLLGVLVSPDIALAVGDYSDAPFCIPTTGYVTQLYGPTPYSPFHNGLDIARGVVGKGPAVYAPYPGEIIYVGRAYAWEGNYPDIYPRHAVVINHGKVNGKYTGSFLVHLGANGDPSKGIKPVSYIVPTILNGTLKTVSMGTLIGYQGTAGQATGTHLHFAVRVKTNSTPFTAWNFWTTGSWTNPKPYIVGSGSLSMWDYLETNCGCSIAPGQGSSRQVFFQQAYDRKGGRKVMGCATTGAFWWAGMVRQDFEGSPGFGRAAILHDEPADNPKFSIPAHVVQGGFWDWYKNNPVFGPPASDHYINAFGLPQTDFRDGFLYWTGGVNPRRYLLKGSGPEAYFVERGRKRWVPNPETLFALGYTWSDVQTIPNSALAVFPTGDPIPNVNDTWLAQYYDNMVNRRPAKVIRGEGDLNFGWGLGSPHYLIPEDNFSARFVKYVNFPVSGRYRFHIVKDDGGRLWIGGEKIFDKWCHTSTCVGHFTVDQDINAGTHLVRFDYYEKGVSATARLWWDSLDKTGPQVWVSFDPTMQEESGWYQAPVAVTLSASDPSGVERIEYRLGGSWQLYKKPIILSDNGVYQLQFRAYDKHGNQSSTYDEQVKIDKTPPEITGAPNKGPNESDWYNKDVTVHFEAGDQPNLSGLKSVTSDTVISIEGKDQEVTGTAEDNAGNTADATVGGINIDKTKPDSELDGLEPYYNDDLDKDPIEIGYEASDVLSGLQRVRLYKRWEGDFEYPRWDYHYYDSLDGGLEASGLFNVGALNVNGELREGRWEFASMAIDQAGNLEWTNDPGSEGFLAVADALMIYDITPPISMITSVEGGAYYNAESWPGIYGVANDNLSGVAQVEVQREKDGEIGRWVLARGADKWIFDLTPEDGFYTIRSRASDLAGNQESTDEISFVYDATPPVTSAELSGAEGLNGWYVSSVGLTLSSDDTNPEGSGVTVSGVSQIWYRIEGLDFQVYESPLPFAEGEYTVSYWAQDRAGNVESEKEISFKIDTVAPNDPANLISSSHTSSTWSADDTIDISWTAAVDTGSGVDGYSYVWDTAPDTLPSAVKLIEETVTSLTSPIIADGNSHYFHLRTVDNAGNWTSTAHLGPFFIDTTAPGDPTNLTSTSQITSTWSSDNTVDLTWTAAADVGSGVDGYSYLWDTSAATLPDAIKDAEETATSLTSPALSDGDVHYFHIRTRDNVDNWTSTLHLGPFWIDTTPPESRLEPLALYYNNHPLDKNPIEINFTHNDNLSGVQQVGLYKRQQGSEWAHHWTSASGNIPDHFSVKTLTEGRWEFASRTTDFAGNAEDLPVEADASAIYDITPPTSAIIFIEESAYYNADSWPGIFGTVDDNLSGVAQVEVRVDKDGEEGEWVAAEGTKDWSFDFTLEDGFYTIYSRATDLAGNQESTDEISFVYDATPPAISGTPTGDPNENGWYNDDVVVQFRATDETSGVALVTEDQVIETEGAGQSVEGVAVDFAGNSSTILVGGINIDQTPPSSQLNELNSYYKNNPLNEDPIELTYTYLDNLSGVEKIRLYKRASGEDWGYHGGSSREATKPFKVGTLEEGYWEFAARAIDFAGNVEGLPEEADTSTIYDITPPTSIITSLEEDAYYNAETWLGIFGTADDNLSGVAQVEVRVDRDGEEGNWEPAWETTGWSLPGFIPSDGFYTVYSRAADRAGNQESTFKVSFIYDNTSPVTSTELSGTEGLNGWHVSLVTLTLNSFDKTSGVKQTDVIIIKDGEKDYHTLQYDSGSLPAFEDGSYVVEFWSVDLVGNEEEDQTISFKIDSVAPSVPVASIPGGTFTEGEILGVSLTAEEGAKIYYALNGGEPILYSNLTAITGDATLSVYAIDEAGNRSASVEFNYVSSAKGAAPAGGQGSALGGNPAPQVLGVRAPSIMGVDGGEETLEDSKGNGEIKGEGAPTVAGEASPKGLEGWLVLLAILAGGVPYFLLCWRIFLRK